MRGKAYERRTLLRRAERAWTYVERVANRLATSRYNPLYHLGTLAVFLLFVLLVTGIYLTIFYRPGAEAAYATVLGISQTKIGLVMRSVHRYAADALVVVILLHALKMLLSDRFWGSRWVAWVTGWGLLVVIWAVGVMGYWLLWDRRAQWLTEYMAQIFGSSFALTFFGPNMASRSFAFFVIVLFLHIFLGVLIFLGFLLHILRLSRPRWLAPRWLMVETALVLLVISLLRPADLLGQADFSRLVRSVPIDWLYLGFLPLATRWGNLAFWALATALLLLVTALPWVLPGKSPGPAQVTEHLCTGCALCALKCPYEAVEIVPRSDESGFKSLATINPNLCVGCGLCIGTCAAVGIDLAVLPTHALLEQMAAALTASQDEAARPVLVVTCQRHSALGSLPQELVPEAVPGVASGTFSHGNGSFPVVTVAFPCVGMLNPEWIRPWLKAEVLGATVLLACPADDCAFREGPYWLAQNLRFRHALLQEPLHWVEATPGDRGTVVRSLAEIVSSPEREESRASRFVATLTEKIQPWLPRGWRPAVASLVLLGVLSLLGGAAHLPTEVPAPPAAIRVVMVHPGKLKAIQGQLSEEMQSRLPPGVSAAQVLGGERYPVRLRVTVDGKTVFERTYMPGGLRREGRAVAVEALPVTPGNRRIQVFMMDDDTTWKLVFDAEVPIAEGVVTTLVYDETQGVFKVQGAPATRR